jgi:hypothetical protein
MIMLDLNDSLDEPIRGINYCIRCCIPETQEGVQFDEMGICTACQSSEEKMHIDWTMREKQLKKILGLVWIGFAIVTAYFCIFEFGLPKLLSSKQEDVVFGIIILFVLTPLIVFGLTTFGYFALKGEYD